MLALTRKKGESIIIGDDIEVVIISIQGEQVKLGINAPKSVSVHRKEIYDQIQESNKASSMHVSVEAMKNIFKSAPNKE